MRAAHNRGGAIGGSGYILQPKKCCFYELRKCKLSSPDYSVVWLTTSYKTHIFNFTVCGRQVLITHSNKNVESPRRILSHRVAQANTHSIKSWSTESRRLETNRQTLGPVMTTLSSRQTETHTNGWTDTTKCIISLASRLIITEDYKTCIDLVVSRTKVLCILHSVSKEIYHGKLCFFWGRV